MRCASLISGLLVLLGSVADAAEGDDLTVNGAGVNVRASPQSGAPILLQVHRSEPAVELAREGDWVRVRLPNHDTVGWIHGSLLSAAGGEPLPPSDAAAATAPPPQAPPPAAGARDPQPEPAARGSGAETEQPGSSDLAAVGGPSTAALDRFRESVDSLNARALAAAGVDLFTEVRLADDDIVQVVATDAWNMVPESGRQSFMNALHDRWLAAVGSPLASLQIVDGSGRLLSEKAAP